jgi:hypothetical protein
VLTPSALAFYVPCSIADAEHVLDRLASENRLRMEVDDDGNIRYEIANRQRLMPRRTSLVRQPPPTPMPIELRPPPNAGAAAILSAIVPVPVSSMRSALTAIAWFVLVTMGYCC